MPDTVTTAIYERGVLRLEDPITLPEHTRVRVVIQRVEPGDEDLHAKPVPAAAEQDALSESTVARRAKIQAEARAWRALPESVRRAYGQDFVAVHEGKVIDRDADRLVLYRRVRGRYGEMAVLITPASATPPREFHLGTR